MTNPMDFKADSVQEETLQRFDPQKPLAVFLVGGEHDLGPAALRVFQSSHGAEYRQILFLSVGILDYGVMDAGVGDHGYDDPEKPRHLKLKTQLALQPYLDTAREMGMTAEIHVSIATDPIEEIDLLSTKISLVCPRTAFFVSKLVFQKPNWFHRFLHNGTSDAIRKRLEKKGFPVSVLPVVVPM